MAYRKRGVQMKVVAALGMIVRVRVELPADQRFGAGIIAREQLVGIPLGPKPIFRTLPNRAEILRNRQVQFAKRRVHGNACRDAGLRELQHARLVLPSEREHSGRGHWKHRAHHCLHVYLELLERVPWVAFDDRHGSRKLLTALKGCLLQAARSQRSDVKTSSARVPASSPLSSRASASAKETPSSSCAARSPSSSTWACVSSPRSSGVSSGRSAIADTAGSLPSTTSALPLGRVRANGVRPSLRVGAVAM